MRIVECYSHLNGKEFILVHQPTIWQEIEAVVNAVDAQKCRTKESGEKRSLGKMFYSPRELNQAFKQELVLQL